MNSSFGYYKEFDGVRSETDSSADDANWFMTIPPRR